jgi:hypothetical protein
MVQPYPLIAEEIMQPWLHPAPQGGRGAILSQLAGPDRSASSTTGQREGLSDVEKSSATPGPSVPIRRGKTGDLPGAVR